MVATQNERPTPPAVQTQKQTRAYTHSHSISLSLSRSSHLSHEVCEEKHVAEEGSPTQQVTDTETAVMTRHVNHGQET